MSVSLLSEIIKTAIYRTNFACCVVWVCSLISDSEGGT
jgi:hypothetical protein